MKKRRLISSFLALFLLLSVLSPIAVYAAEPRPTIFIPSSVVGKNVSDTMYVPSPDYIYQDASMTGTNELTLTALLADSGYARSNISYNLTENDMLWAFNYYAPSDAISDPGRDGGFAFVLHNDPDFLPEKDGDYGALGIYASPKNMGIMRAVAIEFDNVNYSKAYIGSVGWKRTYDDVLSYPDLTPHIAITDPQGISMMNVNIPHEAISPLSEPIWNGSINTVRISWLLTGGASTPEKTDNTYTLKYEYFSGASTFTGTPTAVGSKNYSYNDVIDLFGGELAYFALSGSTGTVGKTQKISFPMVWRYIINYYLQRADGTHTNIPVPTIPRRIGNLPSGPHDFVTLPIPTADGYVFDPSQSTAVYIAPNDETNIFTFYYIDDAPEIHGATPVTISVGDTFDYLAGITATDDEDGEITDISVSGTVNTNLGGIYTLTYSVTDYAGNVTAVDRVITVRSMSDIYNPTVKDENVPYGGVVDLLDNITNRDQLPQNITVADITSPPIDTTVPGPTTGKITVTYPDGSVDVVVVPVIVGAKPANLIYEPEVADEIVEYGMTYDLTDNVTNIDYLPPGTTVTDTTGTTFNTTVPGTYTGKITVLYPDGSTDVKNVTIIVKPRPQNDEYEPIVVNEIVPYGGVINLKDNVTNLGDLPSGTKVTDTTPFIIDTTVHGTYQGQITVTYPDGTADVKTVNVTVLPQPHNEKYNPVAIPEQIPFEGTYDLSDNIDPASIPTDADVTDITPAGTIITNEPGTYTGTVLVSYSDGTSEEVSIPVTVGEQPLNQIYQPQVKDEIVEYGAASYDLTDNVINVSTFPPGGYTITEVTLVYNPQGIDTSVSGTQEGWIRVTYTGDNTYDDVKVNVIVKPQPLNQQYTPEVVNEIVEYGGVINLKDNVTNLAGLPEGTNVYDTTADPINTSGNPNGGSYPAQITVVYPDGSKDVININVTVKPQPLNQIYDPVVSEEIVEYGAASYDITNNVSFTTQPEPTVTVTDTTGKTFDTTESGTYYGQVTVTYSDGSQDVKQVKITIKPQPHNQIYNPNVILEETVEYGSELILTDNVINLTELPDGTEVTDTTVPPIDTSNSGTYTGQITVTYPDDTTDVFQISVTVKEQPHNEKYQPTVSDENVPFGGVIDLTDNITNRNDLPTPLDVKDTTKPAINTSSNPDGASYIGQITVTYPDGTKDVVNVNINVAKQPDNDRYEPAVKAEIVPYGKDIDLSDNITNYDMLPTPNTVSYSDNIPSIDTTVPGTYEAQITVTYPDNTSDTVPVTIIVENPMSYYYDPIVEPEFVEHGTPLYDINLTDNITNVNELPDNIAVTDTTTPGAINTGNPGTYTGQITVTYSDGSADVIDVVVVVGEQPQNEIYQPIADDEVIECGCPVDLTDNITNWDQLPAGTEITYTNSSEINHELSGDYQGIITVKYPDKTEDTIYVNVTILPKKMNEEYQPISVPESVNYGEPVVLNKDNIANYDELKEYIFTITDTSEPAIDSTAPGTHIGQITVTYTDGSADSIPVTVTVGKQPHNDKYEPVVIPETVPYGGTLDFNDNITNWGDLPEGTTVTDTTSPPIDTTQPGTYTAQVTVTYPDTTTDIVYVNVTVLEQPHNEAYEPEVVPETVPFGGTIDLTDNVINLDDLPLNTKVTDTTFPIIDTTVPGSYIGEITITYPDTTTDVIQINITVSRPQNESFEPVVVPENILIGGTIDLTDNVINIGSLPAGTTVTDTTPNPIDTNKPGTYYGQITITYPDGSQDVKNVKVTISAPQQHEQTQNQLYEPIVAEELVQHGGTIDLTDNVINIDKLPAGTTVTDTTKNPINTNVPGIYMGELTITYPDGSTDVVGVLIRVDSEAGSEVYEPSYYHLTYVSNGGTYYETELYGYGKVVSLNKTPTRAGYAFDGWFADKELMIKITEVTMNGNRTVYAGWIEIPVNNYIPEDLNSKKHIAYVRGYSDGTVRPNNNVTRAETATMLYRLLTDTRRAEIGTIVNSFNDVPADVWYNEAVSTMANGGYITGYDDGSFGGDRNITRAEFITMLVRFVGVDKTAECSFADAAKDSWAYDYIATATAAGWISGYSDNTFRPNQLITRAEAMTIINRVLNRGVNEESELLNFKSFPDNLPTDWFYYEVIEATNSHEYTGKRPSEDWTEIHD